MGLLAGTSYDPAGAVAKATTSLLAMTALDTTNLRLVFTVPDNGAVLGRIRTLVHGATTFPQIFLGVLESTTVKARVVPLGALKTTAVATAQLTQEALFVVTGLTPLASLTWDAAYGVDLVVAATNVRYGGPDNTTTNDAWGAICFDLWAAENLLAATNYDPTTAVSKSTASNIAMTAFDTTNLRLTFVAPPSGNVLVRLQCVTHGFTTFPTILLGVLDGSTVRGRQSPLGGMLGTSAATTKVPHNASFVVTGLTPGQSYTWDAAYAVEVTNAAGGLKYGGPDNTTTDDAFGAFQYEVWAL